MKAIEPLLCHITQHLHNLFVYEVTKLEHKLLVNAAMLAIFSVNY